MARATPAALQAKPNIMPGVQADPEDLLAVLVTATNPDGTPYSLPVSEPAVSPSNILGGAATFTATTAPATLITIPAGRTWVGSVWASVACMVAAAAATPGQATAAFSVAGVGATPAPGPLFAVTARAGANAATGTVGTNGENFGKVEVVVDAPAGNAVTIQVGSTNAGSASHVEAGAHGRLL